MSKSGKLYSDSPSLKRDKESGSVGVSKPSEADGENMGTEGSPLPGGGEGMPVQVEQMHGRHEKEMKDMHARHETEHKDMNKRHLKEHKKLMGDAEAKSDSKE